MFDMDFPKKSGTVKIREWRDRYSREEYPGKVVINLFYELFGIEGIWPQMQDIFISGPRYSEFRDAYEQMIALKRSYQVGPLRGLLMEYLATNRLAADTRNSDWSEKVLAASRGDNDAVIEIEYGYWFYNQYCAVTLGWGACGLLGMSKEDAFMEIAGGIPGDLKFDSFGSLQQSLKHVLGIVLDGFKASDGTRVDMKDIVSGKVKTYYPNDFPLLPKLW